MIKDVTLSLRENVPLVEAGGDGLAVIGTHTGFRMKGLSAGLRAAWQQLAKGGPRRKPSPIRYSRRMVSSSAPFFVSNYNTVTRSGSCSTRWSRALARWRSSFPWVAVSTFSTEPVRLDARFRLSRFAYCRRVEQTLMIESPLSAARTILPDGTGAAALLAELATPRTCGDLCARSQTTSRAELHEETAQALLTLLSGAG